MGQVLLWDGKNYQKNIKNPFTKKPVFAGIFLIISIWLVLFFAKAWLLVFLMSLLIIPLIYILIFFLLGQPVKKYEVSCLDKINYGYYNSMREALTTPYPHGVVYILENTLNHLDKFGINGLPSKNTCYGLNESYVDNWLRMFAMTSSSSLIRSMILDPIMIEHGWPNKQALRDVIKIAKLAVENWDNYEPAEQSSTMTNIRQMIQPEVMFLYGQVTSDNLYCYPKIKINQDHYTIDIYQYYYDEEDYRKDTGSQPSKPDFPTTYQSSPQPEYEPTPQTQPQPTQEVLTFREFLAQNTGLLYLSEAGQLEEYHKYLADMGVKPPSS